MLASPLVVAALAGFETTRINSPNQFSADLVNLVVPTRLIRREPTGVANRFPVTEQSGCRAGR